MSDRPSPNPAVTVERSEAGVLTVRLDDGKANVLNTPAIAALDAALDHPDVRALCLIGRPGYFCAGYDLAEMKLGTDQATGLSTAGQALMNRISNSPYPTVAAITGHALAAGAALALAFDVRIAADGPYTIGFPELAKGMALSPTSTRLAVERLSSTHLRRAVLEAALFTPATSMDAGFVDDVVDVEQVAEAAIDRATRLATFPPRSFSRTKALLTQFIAQTDRKELSA